MTQLDENRNMVIPTDWEQKTFTTELQARAWEQLMHSMKNDYRGGTGGAGWRYGYTYTITPFTKE
ncbi:MAG: hypothetical protein EPN82_13250 [Bacteroidetes bacterium]|nr:MAG: hypothetical protein EPN82_13250 [Bacteroidota bacterium]